jgi:hypothetical protein
MKMIKEANDESRKDQVQDMEYDEALELIFKWVQSKQISLKDFKFLIQANRDAV